MFCYIIIMITLILLDVMMIPTTKCFFFLYCWYHIIKCHNNKNCDDGIMWYVDDGIIMWYCCFQHSKNTRSRSTPQQHIYYFKLCHCMWVKNILFLKLLAIIPYWKNNMRFSFSNYPSSDPINFGRLKKGGFL